MNGTVICINCEISKMQKNTMEGQDGNNIDWFQCLFYQDGDLNKSNILTIDKNLFDKKYCMQTFDVVIQCQEQNKKGYVQTRMKIVDFLKGGKSVLNDTPSTK